MKKLAILLGIVFIATLSAYTLTNRSDATINSTKTENYLSDSTKCVKDSTQMKNHDAACCKKDHASCCKKETK